MRPIDLRLVLAGYRGLLLLAGLVLGLGAGLWLARPEPGMPVGSQRAASLEPLVTAIPASTSTSKPTFSPTSTGTTVSTPTPTVVPTETPIPSQTATSRPAYLVWAPGFDGAYLRESPNGRIRVQLENGTAVEWLSEIAVEAGHTWLWVIVCYRNGCPNGWMAESLLYPIPYGDLGRVGAEDGAFLRADPQGNALAWLGPGSPVVLLGEWVESGDFVWARVRTLDEVEGWVLENLLAPFDP